MVAARYQTYIFNIKISISVVNTTDFSTLIGLRLTAKLNKDDKELRLRRATCVTYALFCKPLYVVEYAY